MGKYKLMPQSPTSVATFNTCPRQYLAKYITKEVVFKPNVATERGKAVHKALELRVAKNAPLPADIAKMEPFFSKLLAFSGDKLTECRWAVDKNGEPTRWTQRYIGGAVDLAIINKTDKRAFVFDYKTGAIKDTDDFEFQLVVYALLTLKNFPTIEKVKVAFVGVDQMVLKPVNPEGKKGLVFTREDLPELIGRVRDNVSRIEEASDTGEFIPTPNGLCRRSAKNGGNPWCDVKNCPFWGKE